MLLVPTRKTRVFFSISCALVAAGIVSGRSEFFVASAPFAASIFLWLLREPGRSLTISTTAAGETYSEGESASLSVSVAAGDSFPFLEVTHAFRGADARPAKLALCSLRAGERFETNVALPLPGRGIFSHGEVSVVALTAFCGFAARARGGRERRCVVFPRTEAPARFTAAMYGTRHAGGCRVSRHPGDGMEFSEVRELREGEPARNINWRTTMSRTKIFVNERFQERSCDVVLVADTLRDAGAPPDSCLDWSARAAADIARLVLRGRDSVGLIEYGGFLEWISPGRGEKRLRLILDRLAGLKAAVSYSYRDPGVIPKLGLPAGAFVIVISPLLDERSFRMISGLAMRGFDPFVLYVSPFRPDEGNPRLRREWRAFQENRIRALRDEGLRFVEWDGREPVRFSLERAFLYASGMRKRLRIPSVRVTQ